MFDTIVLATDLSSDWDRIIACAGEFRALNCTRVILTHVIVTKGLVGAGTAAQSGIAPKLEEQAKRLESQGFRVVAETPVGLPAFSLNEVAQRHCASLIVVGSHGKSPWREAVFGSVSNALLHNAKFPILLVNLKRLSQDSDGKCPLRATELLQNVLFPTDFSPTASEAALYLEHLVPSGLAKVTLLYALEVLDIYPQDILEPAEITVRNNARELADRLRRAGVPRVHSRISQGHPIDLILDSLKKEDFSLIAMGTRGRSMISEMLLGSVAYNVSRLAPCPVLLVPRVVR